MLFSWLRSLGRDTRGATSIEYALIASLISIGIVSALVSMSGYLNGVFNSVATAF